jgi:hypothetical protein
LLDFCGESLDGGVVGEVRFHGSGTRRGKWGRRAISSYLHSMGSQAGRVVYRDEAGVGEPPRAGSILSVILLKSSAKTEGSGAR